MDKKLSELVRRDTNILKLCLHAGMVISPVPLLRNIIC